MLDNNKKGSIIINMLSSYYETKFHNMEQRPKEHKWK